MKLVARLAVALNVLALAVPALACDGKEMKTTEKQQAKSTVATAAQKAPAPVKAAEPAQAAKPASVQN